MCNFNPSFSEEARAAIKRYLNSKAAYLNSAGQIKRELKNRFPVAMKYWTETRAEIDKDS